MEIFFKRKKRKNLEMHQIEVFNVIKKKILKKKYIYIYMYIYKKNKKKYLHRATSLNTIL